MARFTQAQRDALIAAIAEGATEVQYQTKKVKYHSLKDMMQLLAIMEADLDVNSTGGSGVIEAIHDKGL